MADPTMTPPTLSALLDRIKQAGGGDRELDGAIALSLGFWKAWRSKHGYWNLDGPHGVRVTVDGPAADFLYDPATGRKLPEPVLPADWIWQVGLPEWTASLDAALALVQARLPGWDWVAASYDNKCWACLKPPGQDDGPDTKEYPGEHSTSPALALLAALLGALIADGVG